MKQGNTRTAIRILVLWCRVHSPPDVLFAYCTQSMPVFGFSSDLSWCRTLYCLREYRIPWIGDQGILRILPGQLQLGRS